MNNVSFFINEFFLKCRASNINYLVLRGYEGLPYKISNDLDLFVHPDCLPSFNSILDNLISSLNLKKNVVLVRQGVVKLYISGEDFHLKLDFWSRLTFWGINYTSCRDLLDNKTLHDCELFNIPSKESEFEISLLKELLHNQLIRTDKIVHLSSIFPEKVDFKDSIFSSDGFYSHVSKSMSISAGKKYFLFFHALILLLFWNFSKHGMLVFSSFFEFMLIKYVPYFNFSEYLKLTRLDYKNL